MGGQKWDSKESRLWGLNGRWYLQTLINAYWLFLQLFMILFIQLPIVQAFFIFNAIKLFHTLKGGSI